MAMKLFKGVVILTGIKLNSFQAELRSNVHRELVVFPHIAETSEIEG